SPGIDACGSKPGRVLKGSNQVGIACQVHDDIGSHVVPDTTAGARPKKIWQLGRGCQNKVAGQTNRSSISVAHDDTISTKIIAADMGDNQGSCGRPRNHDSVQQPLVNLGISSAREDRNCGVVPRMNDLG